MFLLMRIDYLKYLVIFVILIFDTIININKLKATPSEVYHLFRCRNISTRMDGCLLNNMPARTDLSKLIGKKYNYLTILGEAPMHYTSGGSPVRKIMAKCDCGTVKDYALSRVVSSHTMSCGCHQQRRTKEACTIHGLTETNEHKIWRDMQGRCNNPKNKSYSRYGGRGIKVSDEWKNSFLTFLADMGPRPSKQHSIERADNDGDYCKENCSWQDNYVQSRNTSQNNWLTFNGETLCITDWGVKLGFGRTTINRRLQLGWTVEKALSTPMPVKHKVIDIEAKIVYNTIAEAAKVVNVSPQTLGQYLSGKYPNKTNMRYYDGED